MVSFIFMDLLHTFIMTQVIDTAPETGHRILCLNLSKKCYHTLVVKERRERILNEKYFN